MALASRALGRASGAIIMLGIISGALFYGDAIITPALSVLSAVEGLKVVTPAFETYVVPITVVILVALFLVQSRGTASVAAFFGPVMLVWFAVIALRRALAHRPASGGALRLQSLVRRSSFSDPPRHHRLLSRSAPCSWW